MNQRLFDTLDMAPVTGTGFTYNDSKSNRTWYFESSTISNLNIDVEPIWTDYTGAGIKVAVIDSQIDFSHRELSRAYDHSLDFSFATDTATVNLPTAGLTDPHGTMVGGVIAAESNNTTGSAGIAHGATLMGLAIDYSSASILDHVHAALIEAAHSDVVNNSWSFTTPFEDNFSDQPRFEDALAFTASTGRDGLGTSIVFSAGNTGMITSSNYHNFQNSPYTIAVGSVSQIGEASSFSSVGANVLLAAPGQNVYTTQPADRYGSTEGTSFAAPAVSATVALMLEANDMLGYRDIQQILALSARRDGLENDPANGDGWRITGTETVNGGGAFYSDAVGFGFLNAHDAVRLAETWTLQQTAADRATVTEVVQTDALMTAGLVDHLSLQIDVDEDMLLEHVQLSMDFGWRNTADVDVYLTSAQGTTARLVYDTPDTGAIGSFENFWFTSVASMGEEAAGTWQLDIYNRDPDATARKDIAMKAMLDSVSLKLHGRDAALQNDTYFYTDDFELAVANDAAGRLHLSDDDGGVDTLNAAAITSATSVDLAGGRAVISGHTVALTNSGIEKVITGDGDDTLVGDTADNLLAGGRGDDRIHFGAGSDTLDGGLGIDTLVLETALTGLTGYANEAGDVFLGFLDGPFSLLKGFEYYSLSGVDCAFSSLLVDVADGRAGDETLNGGGEDTIGTGDDTPDGHGDDTISTGDDTPTGTEPDRILGSNGHEKLRGADGSEWLSALGGDDTVFGGLGADTLLGEDGADLLKGDAGDDVLFGGAGTDTLVGHDGADLYVFDVTDLGAADNVKGFDATKGDRIALINVDDPSDISVALSDGGRVSTLTVTQYGQSHTLAELVKPVADASAIVTLGSAESAQLLSGWKDMLPGGDVEEDPTDEDTTGDSADDDQPTQIETIIGTEKGQKTFGTDAHERISALGGDDCVFGAGGQDTILGGAGNDKLYGEAGDDVLIGGTGQDTLSGGGGADIFIFDLFSFGAIDTLKGFNGSEGDLLVVANTGMTQDITFDVRHEGRASTFSVTVDGVSHDLAVMIKPQIGMDDIELLAPSIDEIFL